MVGIKQLNSCSKDKQFLNFTLPYQNGKQITINKSTLEKKWPLQVFRLLGTFHVGRNIQNWLNRKTCFRKNTEITSISKDGKKEDLLKAIETDNMDRLIYSMATRKLIIKLELKEYLVII